MAAWPGTLPAAPLANGGGLEPVPQSVRTDMEFGAARSRRISKARNDKVSVSWNLSDAQMDIFRTWFENDSEAAGGSAWFTISLRIGDTGATSQEARFIGAFRAQPVGAQRWLVSATLEVR